MNKEVVVVIRLRSLLISNINFDGVRELLYEQWEQTPAYGEGDRISVNSIGLPDNTVSAHWPTEFR